MLAALLLNQDDGFDPFGEGGKKRRKPYKPMDTRFVDPDPPERPSPQARRIDTPESPVERAAEPLPAFEPMFGDKLPPVPEMATLPPIQAPGDMTAKQTEISDDDDAVALLLIMMMQ
jgi:hypothetical protein